MSFIAIFLLQAFAPIANARLIPAVWMHQGSDAGKWMHNPQIVQTLEGIPGVVHGRQVRLTGPNSFDLVLAQSWSWVEQYYIKNNPPIFNSIYNAMKDVYFNKLLSHDDIAAQLAKYQINVKPTDWFYPTTYELTDSPNGESIVTFSVESVCTNNHEVVPTHNALDRGLLAIPPCQGGAVYSVEKINRVYYNPMCAGTLCNSVDDLQNPVWVKPLLIIAVRSKR